MAATRGSFGMVEVFTDEGLTGICPSPANPEYVEHTLKPRMLGENPLDYERIWHKLQPRFPRGILDTAKIDIALWDLIGKILGQPVWRLLGGAQSEVRVYCAGGFYAEGKLIQDLQDEMLEYVEMGYRAVKMKIGGAPFDEDVARVRAVREAVGPEVDVLIDANHAWTAAEAIRFARVVEELSPFWFEEPTESQNPRACAEVRAVTSIPIATGENLEGRYAHRALIDGHGADIIQADAGYCGGITEWRKIAAYAQAHNLRMAPHGSAIVGSHLVAGVTHGLIVESDPHRAPRSGAHWRPSRRRPAVFQIPPVQDGKLVMTEEPGLGLQIDYDQLQSVREGAHDRA